MARKIDAIFASNASKVCLDDGIPYVSKRQTWAHVKGVRIPDVSNWAMNI